MSSPAPFSRFEWLIAWRYLRARRAEGGVSVMTWISLIGITLAVAALIITLAVRAGFRAEFVDTILGANAHVTVYSATYQTETGATSRAIADFDPLAERLRAIPEVTRAAPLVRAQVMLNARDENAGAEVFGIRGDDLRTIPRLMNPAASIGDIN
ncbi:MAG: ABC transporter permease, partial [Pseudomonadota bacterium]